MPKPPFLSVEDYLASHPVPTRAVLETVRNSIRKAVPEAREEIAYNMPTYKLNGELVLHFAGWKHHFSLYPASDTLLAAFKKELAPYKIDKGTIRFPLNERPPVNLIQRIAQLRAAEAKQRKA